jgi:hypothetical protein
MQRLTSTQDPLSSFAITPGLTTDQGDQALCFFNAFYVRGPRERGTNIWAEQIMPRLIKLEPDSVLALSSTAVATQMLNKERGNTIRSPAALKSYLKAVALLRTMLDTGLETHYDQILPSIFMLEIFETISNIVGESEYTAIHQNAGMRTVQRAMGLKLQAASATKAIASALQSRYVWTCFATGVPASLFALEDRSYPGTCGELDIYGAEMANILHERNVLLGPTAGDPYQLKSPLTDSDSSEESIRAMSALLLRTINLLADLKTYYDQLPSAWRPRRIPVNSPDFHPSIQHMGMYQSLCDVYSSLPTSHSNALYRVVRIAALQTRWLFERRLASSSRNANVPDPNADTYDTDADALGSGFDCQPEVQGLVDDICAAVPFHLGNRGVSPTGDGAPTASVNTNSEQYAGDTHHPRKSPVDTSTRMTFYPPSSSRLRRLVHFIDEHGNSTNMTDAAHATEASTKGGYMILVPLSLLLGVFQRGAALAADVIQQNQPNPFTLRDGQMQWIQLQLVRAATVQVRPLTG